MVLRTRFVIGRCGHSRTRLGTLFGSAVDMKNTVAAVEPEKRLVRKFTTKISSFDLNLSAGTLYLLGEENTAKLISEGWVLQERTADWHTIS